jgi:hypothetical protein
VFDKIALEVLVSVIASLVIMSGGLLFRKAIAFRLQTFVLRNMKIGIRRVSGYEKMRRAFISALATGHSARLMAIMGIGFLSSKDVPGRLHNSVLGSFLSIRSKSAPNVKVLLLDPRSRYVSARAEELFSGYRSEVNQTRKIANGIIHSLDDLLDLQEEYGGIEIRIHDQKPLWRIALVDQTLFLGMYLRGIRSYQSVFYTIVETPKSLYPTFEAYFESTWEGGTEVNRVLLSQIIEELKNNQ